VLNMILCLACAAAAIIAAVRAIMQKRLSNNEELKLLSASIKTDIEDSGDERTADENQNKSRRLRPVWLVASAAAVLAGAILFITTEDTKNAMVLIDLWTALHVVLVAAGAAATILVIRIMKEIVVFDTDDGREPLRKKVAYGQPIQEPVITVRQGLVIAGWYTDKDYATKWDFNSKIKDNITLYAKWSRKPQKTVSNRAKK